jgi:hypothetical protein
MTDAPAPQPIPNIDPHARWKFLRDVAVFEFKLALNNLHNFFQIPLTLGAAVLDLVFNAKQEGAFFYKTVEYGRLIDDSIDIYSVIADREKSLNKDFTVDALVSQIESVVVREYEKGGSAATVKAAVDKVIDGLQTHAERGKDQAAEAIKRAAEKMRAKDIDPSA